LWGDRNAGLGFVASHPFTMKLRKDGAPTLGSGDAVIE